jgi:serine/threonine protein kinase
MSEESVFLTALEKPTPAERAAYLQEACAGNPELRRRVEALLWAHDQSGDFLDPPPVGAQPTVPAGFDPAAGPASPRAQLEGPGTRIGPYKLVQLMGEGGMGVVFRAEQEAPIRREVALKVIKPGMDTARVVARFEAERQALALMDHIHIAKVLDAGTTDAGRPFFVMELVDGVPITDYCDAHRLDIPARLALFRQVCAAVQHAHQKGIIHRDLKPSNILVEAHDPGAPGVPKVIDFGLAKATGGLRLSEQTLFTSFGAVAGSPLYMAPEQARYSAPDVDTRADIYALGAILYELLAGSTPIARESIQQAALDEMLRVIREVDPLPPSSRISTSAALPSLAATRQVEPARLSRLVRGDLDWIVMKALAKERERRYASAIGLADDIERHLNHEPVSAGPPTAAYRLRKLVRRNRVQVTAAALVLFALLLGVAGMTLGLFEARRQERIAEAQRKEAEKRAAQVTKMNEILGSIFQDLNPQSAARQRKPLSAILGERLDRATAEIEGEATGDPLAVARMQMILGNSQFGLGYPDRAIRLYTKARDTFAAKLGPDHPDTLRSMNNLANSFRAEGQNDQAMKLHEETLALRKAKLGRDHPDTLISMNNLANSYGDAGQNDRALALHEETLALRKAKLGPDHSDTLVSMTNVANRYGAAGQYDRSLALHEETLALLKAKLGLDHPDTLSSMNHLTNSYVDAGQNERALALREETLALRTAKFGPDHPDTLRSMMSLANSYAAAGQNERALKLREATPALMRSKLGPDHPDTLGSMINLAVSYADTGQNERALKLYAETLERLRSKLRPDHEYILESLECQARCLANCGQLDRARANLDEVIAARRKSQGDGHRDTLRSRMTRAELDRACGRLGAALAADGAILEECRARLGADDRLTIAAELALARARGARGDREAAATLYQAALESARKNSTDREMLATALTESGRSRLEAGDRPAAEAVLREALAIREREMPQHWRTAEARSLLGAALWGHTKAAEAVPLLRSGYEGMARCGAAIPLVDRHRLAEALDRLIAAGEAAGTRAEIAAWKAERAKLGAGESKL